MKLPLRLLAVLAALIFLAPAGRAQGPTLPAADPDFELLRRSATKYGLDGLAAPATSLNLEPLTRVTGVRLMKSWYQLHRSRMNRAETHRFLAFFDRNNELLAVPNLLNETDADRAAYFLGDNLAVRAEQSTLYRRARRPVGNWLYQTPAYAVAVNRPDFSLRLNPVLDLRYGQQADDPEGYLFNRRGLRLRASVDSRFHLFFELHETQVGAPNYLRRRVERGGALPGAGFFKNYTLDLADVRNGYDFLNGRGYLSADVTRHVGLRLGYGNHFIGRGERSLLLSDFSNNYPFLEVNWRVWKFHYRNIFAELTSGPANFTGQLFEKKYLAAHYLSINLGRRLTLGVFESVVLNRDDGFELAYLNPVIFYRTVEQSVGSPDNALLGLTADYTLPFRTTIYGQFTLDEFKFAELFTRRRGWWGNKWAYQLGARHVDALGIEQLDLVVEYNRARPFVFTHRGESSYTHFNLPLAHPLGANFSEFILGGDYRPWPRLNLSGRLYLIDQGKGEGDDITVSSDTRERDFGHYIGQGESTTTRLFQGWAGYELRSGLWLEGELLLRDQDAATPEFDQRTILVNLGVRMNVHRRREAF